MKHLGLILIVFLIGSVTLKAQPDSVNIVKSDSTTLTPADSNSVKIQQKPNNTGKQPEGQLMNFSAYDTIVKTNRKKVIAKVLNQNLFDIEVIYPGNNKTQTISTSVVKEIRLANGRVKVVDNRPESQEKDWVNKGEVDWKDVIVTNDAAQITGLTEVGSIEISYESNKMDVKTDYMEKMATVSLKRKAFKMAATTVLITGKDVTREYGEYPQLTLKGVAYTKE